MMKMCNCVSARFVAAHHSLWEKTDRFFREEKGDLVSSLGWMAIMALVLVLIKGLVDGKLVGYVNTIFVHLDRVFNP